MDLNTVLNFIKGLGWDTITTVVLIIALIVLRTVQKNYRKKHPDSEYSEEYLLKQKERAEAYRKKRQEEEDLNQAIENEYADYEKTHLSGSTWEVISEQEEEQ